MSTHTEEQVMQAIEQSIARQESILVTLSNLLWRQIHILKSTVQEFGVAINNSFVAAQPMEQGTEIIHMVLLSIDPLVGGTFVLQMGNIAMTFPCPVSGLFTLYPVAFILKSNATRSVTVTPSSSPPKYMTLVLFGEPGGDSGYM